MSNSSDADRRTIEGNIPSGVTARPTTLDAITLAGLIRAAPDLKLVVWLISVEDRYETILGDGFYSYVEKAFLKEEEAAAWAKWINDSASPTSVSGYKARVSSTSLTLSDARQDYILQLLNDGEASWKYTIKFCQDIRDVSPPVASDLVTPDHDSLPETP